jgi:diguanylate cyclase (GGDEF)-like protein
MLVAIADVSERMRAEARISYLAHHDALTGLANRIRFHEALDEALARNADGVTLFLLDLDGFKPVNDTYGHAVGDELLRLVAGRLRAAARGGDHVARLGGDEFALVRMLPLGEPSEMAERLIAMLSAPFHVTTHQITIGVSVGIARAGPRGDTDRLLALADTALYTAKRAGKNTWRAGAVEPGAHRIA